MTFIACGATIGEVAAAAAAAIGEGAAAAGSAVASGAAAVGSAIGSGAAAVGDFAGGIASGLTGAGEGAAAGTAAGTAGTAAGTAGTAGTTAVEGAAPSGIASAAPNYALSLPANPALGQAGTAAFNDMASQAAGGGAANSSGMGFSGISGSGEAGTMVPTTAADTTPSAGPLGAAGNTGIVDSSPGPLMNGLKSIGNYAVEHPPQTLIGVGSLLSMAGRPKGNSQMPTSAPVGKANVSPNFQRYVPAPRAANYAAGGIAQATPFTPPTPQIPAPTQDSKPVPVNPFYARGMQLAQQTQQQAQPPLVGDQVPQAPTAQLPQGIVQPVQTAASGGLMGSPSLGSYAHGGISRLLRGPGDGVSDDIPAEIEGRQPARLADGEFVVPARIVSELGNGSTEAGGKALQAMVDRVQSRRAKTTGKGKFATNSKAIKELPV